MTLEELEQRYGLYVAEMLRQSMTLEEFDRLEIDELVDHFVLCAERTYDEYDSRRNAVPADVGIDLSRDEYLSILRRRWQEAEELAQMVIEAHRSYQSAQQRIVGA